MTKRVALITDGTGELGEAIGAKLSKAGYGLVMTYSPSDKASTRWLQEMHARGYDLRSFGWYPCDVNDEASWRYCLSAITSDRGPIDVFVNAADAARGPSMIFGAAPLLDITKRVCDAMADRGWGRIINVSWWLGEALVQAHYAAVKAGLDDFTKSLALAVAEKGVTVNAISSSVPAAAIGTLAKETVTARLQSAPGPKGSMRDEVAALVAFLCSDAAAAVTGSNFAINGSSQIH